MNASSTIAVTNGGSGSSPSSPSSSSTSPSSKGSNAGAIAGGVIGGLAAAALIGFGTWFLHRRRSQKTSHPLDMDEARPEPYGHHPTLPGFVPVPSGAPSDRLTHPTVVTHQETNGNRNETLTSPSQYSPQTESTTPGVLYNPYGSNTTLSDKELARLRELNANAPPGTIYAPASRAAAAGRAVRPHRAPKSSSVTTDSRTGTGSGSGSGTASGSGSRATDSNPTREAVPGNLIGEVEALRREMNQLRADRQTSYEPPPSYAGY